MDRIVRIGVSILEKKVLKRIKGVEDKKLQIVLSSVIEMAILIIKVFIDSNKDNKAQLKELKPVILDKGLGVIEQVLEIEE